MTGSQLKALRQAYGWSQRDIAAKLVDVTDVTVSRWEAAGAKEIPTLAAERLLGGLEMRLPITELRTMLDIARTRGVDFDTILHEALREYIERHARARGIPLVTIDEAMKSQTERVKQVIERSHQPPTLRVAKPDPSYAAGQDQPASSAKRKRHA